MNKLSEVFSPKLEISNRTIIRVFSIALLYVVGLWFVYSIRQALVLIAISFFLAVALSNPVNFLTRHMPGGKRSVATGVAFAFIILVISVITYSIIPPMVSQSQAFINNLPSYIDNLENGEGFVAENVQQFELTDSLRESQEQLRERLGDASGPLFNGVKKVTSSFINMLTILVITFLMLVESPRWLKGFWELFPNHHQKRYRDLAHKLHRVVSGFVNGQLLIAAIASLVALIAMLIIGIPFAVPLAAIIGVFVLIPLIGATIGAAFVVLITLFTSISKALIFLIFFVIYQQIENNFIQPIVQSKTLNLSPLTIFISAIIGVVVGGILGALFAIPVAGSIKVIGQDYIEHNKGKLSRL